MRKIRAVALIVSFFGIQSSFADTQDMMSFFHSKPCASVAEACKKAGYVRDQNADKRFWVDCMKPVLLGKTVKDVTVDEKTVKACRTDKIDELKKELNEFQQKAS